MDFYYMKGCPACRTVQMFAAALGVDLNLKYTNLMEGEHLKPEFVKLNSQHTLPTIVDGDYVLWESRAICIYLAEKYNHKLYYPDCPKIRGIINQRLHFDNTALYFRFADFHYPQIFFGKSPDMEKLNIFQEALELLNTFLEGQKYAVGDSLTIADFSLVTTISSIESAGYDFSSYPNIIRWYELCKQTIPFYAINEEGLMEYKNKFCKQ